jgi:hypothetical protein
MTILFFILMQKAGNCDYFDWADNKMTTYEERLMKYLRGMEERRLAEKGRVDELIKQKCKEHADKLSRELGLGQNNGQNNGKMFRAALLVGILVLVFYFIGYSGLSEPRSTKLMLK